MYESVICQLIQHELRDIGARNGGHERVRRQMFTRSIDAGMGPIGQDRRTYDDPIQAKDPRHESRLYLLKTVAFQSRASPKLDQTEPGLYLLLGFQKQSVRWNDEVTNQTFQCALDFLTIRASTATICRNPRKAGCCHNPLRYEHA